MLAEVTAPNNDLTDPQQQAAVVTPSSKEDSSSTQAQLCNHTDEMLESVDSCVGCVNQIALQQDFEDGLAHVELPIHEFGEPISTLSESEATLIRLQVAEKSSSEQQQHQQQTTTTVPLPDMDLLNLCAGSDADDKPAMPYQTTTTTRKIEASAALPEAGSRCCSPALLVTGRGGEQRPCAICNDTVSQIADLPCCQGKDICVSCMQLVTYLVTEHQRVGHCPCCRAWISIKPDLEIAVVQPVTEQTCSICNQVKDYMLVQDNDETVCDACFLGRRHPLEFECEACHVRQRIPHPMYRYQNSPDEFGQVTWACSEKKCGSKFSHWRICADQVALIPVGDAPWGSSMDTARQFVQQVRRHQFLQEQAQQVQQAQSCIIL